VNPRVLLVGWEVADWNLLSPWIDAGRMENLRGLVEDGVSGNLRCPPPLADAALWMSMATGKRAWQHGVLLPVSDEKARYAPLDNSYSDPDTLWNVFAAHGWDPIVVGWPMTHGANFQTGAFVSDRYSQPTGAPGMPWRPAVAGTYWPPEIAGELDPLRVRPEEIDSGAIAHFVPHWADVDQSRDPRLAQLRVLLAADFSSQAAITHLMGSAEWDFATVRFRAIGEICRIFGRADTELYCDVLPSAFRLLDEMLGHLVKLAGEDTAVVLVSSHGFSSAGESWKKPSGLFAARGPGLERDKLVHGASVQDIAPTILALAGIPPIAGYVLEECFETKSPNPKVRAAIPQVVGERNLRSSLDPAVKRNFDWNHACSLLDAGHVEQALPVLEILFRDDPEDPVFAQSYFQCMLASGRVSGAGEVLEAVLDCMPHGAATLLAQAEYALARGEHSRVRELLAVLLSSDDHGTDAWRRIGLLLIGVRDWETLERQADNLLRVDPRCEMAWVGLAEALLRRGKPGLAAAAAMRAIGLNFFLPDAHFILARSLAAQSMWLAALQSMERLLAMQPENELARGYVRRLGRMLRGEPSLT
jgi:hypothetical protein